MSSAKPLDGRCGAKCRDGGFCARYPLRGAKRCRRHSGGTPVGPAHHSWKHGRYSRYMSTAFLERYAELRDDAGLIELRDEIAVARARVGELIESVERVSDDGATVDPSEAWEQIRVMLAEIRKLSESERRRMEAASQMMSAERVVAMISEVLSVLREHVTPPVLALVAQEIRRRTSMPASAFAGLGSGKDVVTE